MEQSIVNQCYSNGFGISFLTHQYTNNAKITCKLQQNNESRRNKSTRIKSQFTHHTRNFRRIRNFLIGAGIGSGILPVLPIIFL